MIESMAALDVSLDHLANQCGCTDEVMGRIIDGHEPVTREIAIAIEGVLGISPTILNGLIDKAFKKDLAKVTRYQDSEDYYQRDIIITAHCADYGKPSGYLVSINGSPPKGEIFVIGDLENPHTMIAISVSGKITALTRSRQNLKHSRLWKSTIQLLCFRDPGLFSKIAKDKYDGHFTIFSFTTGYKAAFGTPNLDTGEGREQVNALRHHDTMSEAIDFAIQNDVSFKG